MFLLDSVCSYIQSVVIVDWPTAKHSAYLNPCADYITPSFSQWLKEETIDNVMRTPKHI